MAAVVAPVAPINSRRFTRAMLSSVPCDVKLQSCLMQDEPEGGVGFSHKMSLEEGIGMLGIDHQHGRRRKAEPGGDPGISGIKRRGEFRSSGPGGVIRMGGSAFAAARLRWSETSGQRTGTALRGEDDRVEPRASDAADPVLPARRGSEAASLRAALFYEPLYRSRHRTTGRGGRGSRDVERASHAEDSGTGAA